MALPSNNNNSLAPLSPAVRNIRTSNQRRPSFSYEDFEPLGVTPHFVQGVDFDADEIIPGLWLGDYNSSLMLEELQHKHISHIISAARDATPWFPAHFKYLKLDIDDRPSEDILMHFENTANFITEGRQYGGVLVHCIGGLSRSGAIVIAYLMITENLDFPTALARVQAVRPYVAPNYGFEIQLELFERMNFTLTGDTEAHREYLLYKEQILERAKIKFVVSGRKADEVCDLQREDDDDIICSPNPKRDSCLIA
eukprot:TRINITY_DN289_c3_g1_i2.p1 TRINITY_DN289_c3_g1~~TRINITY_DN289_c3_g1_i2.p1  ORF type:complete len:254 (-),score=123.11 TRINITY_DN289_c3_g1_i2:55-816(-)